ncbi:MAG TPA: alpha/beta hydrolase [Actinomycetota bacterium]
MRPGFAGAHATFVLECGMRESPWTTESIVDAAGTEIFYRERGSGTPVLLLHGFPQTGHCWSAVAGTLGRSHRVLVPDLPGLGRSGRPPGFDARTLGATMAGFLEAVDAAPAVIVGHDWGGAVAYRLAAAHPGVTDRLVVVNSPYGSIDWKRGWYMLAFNIPVIPELAFTVAGDRIVDAFLRAGSADPAVFDRERTAPYRESLRGLERQRNAFAYYRTMTRRVLRRAIRIGPRAPASRDGRITAPAMIVWGMKDPALPPSLLASIERAIPHARIERLHEAGHFVPEEAPERLAELIAGFCDESPATTSHPPDSAS